MLEAEAEVVFSALERNIREWQALIPVARPHFRVIVPGGTWTQDGYEVPCKEGLARHVGQAAQDWCRRFKTGEQKSYGWKKYDEDIAMNLCHLWADRMEYYFMIMEESGQGLAYRYTDNDFLDAPEPSHNLLELIRAKPAEHPSHTALAQLMALRPTNPPMAAGGSGA